MRQYASYIASGSQWLDSIPAHWKMGRLDHVARAWPSNVDKHSVEGELPVRLCNYTDVYKNDAIVAELPFMAATASAEQMERFRIRVGDTIITKDSETADDIGIPAFVDYEADDLVCGYHLSIVRPDPAEICPKYLFWALRAQPTLGQWEVLASGVTRVGLRSGDVSKAALALPPLDEQRAIADYLDRETARIDTLIEEQQRLIEMLRERRGSLIERTASGADTSSPSAPTESRWWPRLPLGWRAVRMRRVVTFVADGPHFSPTYVDDGRMFISARNIKVDRWALEDAKFVSEEDFREFSKRVIPEKGDVLYTKGGTTGIARVVDLDFPFQVWVHVAVLKVCRKSIDPYYLAYTLNSTPCYDQSQLYTRGATNNDLGLTRMVCIEIPLPPLDEQRRIVAYLDGQTAKIDALIAETETFIELARERRAALITAAVTGQIDVRGAA